MNLGIVKTGARHIGDILSKNSPTILTWLGVSGVVTTVAMAMNDRDKATRELNYARDQREKDSLVEGYGRQIDPISKIDAFKLTWKCYIPTIGMALATTACIVGANSINLRRNAALAGLYSLTETAFKEYQAKVVETLGERKEEKLRDEMAQDKLNRNPVDGQSIIVTGDGETLCFDSLSGRYFKSDIEKLRKLQNDFNYRLLSENYRPLNEWYDDIGLEPVEMGRDVGWTNDVLLDIRFSAKLATNNKPCIVLEYRIAPHNI